MNKTEIFEQFYINKNYSRIEELLKNSSEVWSFNMLGKMHLWQGDLKQAYYYFYKAEAIYPCAYCKFLNHDNKEARILANLIKEHSSIANWLLFLISFLEDKKEEEATYFQIRSFFEQDFEMLFKYNHKEAITKIIKNISYFAQYNKEVYKYTGRVLLNNNCYKLAEEFLNKSLEIYYKDPETHYILGDLHLAQKDIHNAKKEYELANEVNGEYFPAKRKLTTL